MNLIRKPRCAAAVALLLMALAVPAASSATAGTPAQAPTVRAADLIEPPLPVEAFPRQVKEACGI
ncbi:hypothetical protein [Streptomyces sp. NPDC051567]|uniref:hypothetical protein n=1 Tax=Streptomyces sp. NPDC051567 TaxID=3365660 RepID=UPI0037922105